MSYCAGSLHRDLSMLELRGVEGGYGGTTVLRDVSLSIAPGSVVALLGPNGAGKRTTMRMASGLLRPRGGRGPGGGPPPPARGGGGAGGEAARGGPPGPPPPPRNLPHHGRPQHLPVA